MSKFVEREQATVRITSMTLEHLSWVIEIEKQCFSSPWSYGVFFAELSENDNAIYLCAWLGDRLVGYAGMWVILDEGHITNIAVSPRLRGQGIGRQLLQAIETAARLRGARRATLEVRVSNKKARKLYARSGYKSAGVRPNYYLDNNEDAMIMWKELTCCEH